jgi:hypothetical protein
MFDGTRRLPEQRVSLLLRINPRRYDPAHVAAVHRLLAVPAEAGDAEGIDAAALVARLLRLADVLALWRASSEALGRELDGAQAALVASVDAQNATLQRMLYDAGVTREQLAAIAADVGATRRCGSRPGRCRGLLWQPSRRRQPARRPLARRSMPGRRSGARAAWFEPRSSTRVSSRSGSRRSPRSIARLRRIASGRAEEPDRDNRRPWISSVRCSTSSSTSTSTLRPSCSCTAPGSTRCSSRSSSSRPAWW